MIENYLTPEFIGLVIVGLAGWGYAAIVRGTLKDVVGTIQTFARMSTTYYRIKADGKITSTESTEFGELSIAFFEELETIVRKSIFNDASVPFVLPEQKSIEGEPVDVAAAIQQIESLLSVLQSIGKSRT